MMGAVGRLIFVMGLLLAWPTIYAFVVQISNEMITAVFPLSGPELQQLVNLITVGLRSALIGVGGLLAQALATVVGLVVGSFLGGPPGAFVGLAIGAFIGFIGFMIFSIFLVWVLIQVVHLVVLKAVQVALLLAQFVFAPFFLVFMLIPDTEQIAVNYIRSFVETSLWGFIWIVMLRILSITVSTDMNGWIKFAIAIGILELMIRVPEFLAHARISPSSHLVDGAKLANSLSMSAQQFSNLALGLVRGGQIWGNQFANVGFGPGKHGQPKAATASGDDDNRPFQSFGTGGNNPTGPKNGGSGAANGGTPTASNGAVMKPGGLTPPSAANKNANNGNFSFPALALQRKGKSDFKPGADGLNLPVHKVGLAGASEITEPLKSQDGLGTGSGNTADGINPPSTSGLPSTSNTANPSGLSNQSSLSNLPGTPGQNKKTDGLNFPHAAFQKGNQPEFRPGAAGIGLNNLGLNNLSLDKTSSTGAGLPANGDLISGRQPQSNATDATVSPAAGHTNKAADGINPAGLSNQSNLSNLPDTPGQNKKTDGPNFTHAAFQKGNQPEFKPGAAGIGLNNLGLNNLGLNNLGLDKTGSTGASLLPNGDLVTGLQPQNNATDATVSPAAGLTNKAVDSINPSGLSNRSNLSNLPSTPGQNKKTDGLNFTHAAFQKGNQPEFKPGAAGIGLNNPALNNLGLNGLGQTVTADTSIAGGESSFTGPGSQQNEMIGQAAAIDLQQASKSAAGGNSATMGSIQIPGLNSKKPIDSGFASIANITNSNGINTTQGVFRNVASSSQSNPLDTQMFNQSSANSSPSAPLSAQNELLPETHNLQSPTGQPPSLLNPGTVSVTPVSIASIAGLGSMRTDTNSQLSNTNAASVGGLTANNHPQNAGSMPSSSVGNQQNPIDFSTTNEATIAANSSPWSVASNSQPAIQSNSAQANSSAQGVSRHTIIPGSGSLSSTNNMLSAAQVLARMTMPGRTNSGLNFARAHMASNGTFDPTTVHSMATEASFNPSESAEPIGYSNNSADFTKSSFIQSAQPASFDSSGPSFVSPNSGQTNASVTQQAQTRFEEGSSQSAPHETPFRGVNSSGGNFSGGGSSGGGAGSDTHKASKFWYPFQPAFRNFAASARAADKVKFVSSQDKPAFTQFDTKDGSVVLGYSDDMNAHETAAQIATAAATRLLFTDAGGYDAARQAAVSSGALNPVGFKEKMAAMFLATRGQSFAETNLAKHRMNQQIVHAAHDGAKAWYAGESGNEFTDYLSSRYRPVNEEMRDELAGYLSDDSRADSPFNHSYSKNNTDVFASGTTFDGFATKRELGQTPYLVGMHPARKRVAFETNAAYLMAKAESVGVPMDQRDTYASSQVSSVPTSVLRTNNAVGAELGYESCQNWQVIDTVAAMSKPEWKDDDYANNYLAVARGSEQVRQLYSQGGYNQGSNFVNAVRSSSPEAVSGMVISNLIDNYRVNPSQFRESQFLQTAMECYAEDKNSLPYVASAASIMGARNVTKEDVFTMQELVDTDPRWERNMSASDIYTAQAVNQSYKEAERENPGQYAKPNLNRKYVQDVRSDLRFTPRPPERNGSSSNYGSSNHNSVPRDLLKTVAPPPPKPPSPAST